MPWNRSPETEPTQAAIAQLDAHFATLGCQVTGDLTGRFDGLLEDIQRYQTAKAQDEMAEAVSNLRKDRSLRHVQLFARSCIHTFLEPTPGLAEQIDHYGLATDYLARPGAFGRRWCHHVTETSWTIWISGRGFTGRPAGLSD
ncbi:hypothetical protein [Streptomyces sp. SM12]|uniref:hypothetical protein n=1 Tax=Streptomyces sp. SM12 TaxID=1071602 RepID=UPI000CD5C530|nr:hypothetical protein [Streptomyces sp. SM12]